MVDPVVRSARPDDVEQLTSLECEARAALVGQRGRDRWLDTRPSRGERWGQTMATGHVQVALIGEVLVGYLASHHDGGLAYVDEVYVTPEAREVGFGDALLEAATSTARAAGCTTIEGEALPGDRDIKNLYE